MRAQSWQLSGELTRVAAESLELTLELLADMKGMATPTLSRFEQPGSDLWRVDIFFADRPSETFVEELLDKTGLDRWRYECRPVAERDWVSESQKLLAPVRAGRFLVFGAHDADKADASLINLQIDAGQAFGTGKHETTAACLVLLEQTAENRSPANFLDLGTGSGVLAIAANKLWPEARGTATDIDPIAIDVAEQNCRINHTPIRAFEAPAGGVALATADGLEKSELVAEGPYELVVANILAGPLIEMAEAITAAVADNGAMILSGLLNTQKEEVLAAYMPLGLKLEAAETSGEWVALKLLKSPK